MVAHPASDKTTVNMPSWFLAKGKVSQKRRGVIPQNGAHGEDKLDYVTEMLACLSSAEIQIHHTNMLVLRSRIDPNIHAARTLQLSHVHCRALHTLYASFEMDYMLSLLSNPAE